MCQHNFSPRLRRLPRVCVAMFPQAPPTPSPLSQSSNYILTSSLPPYLLPELVLNRVPGFNKYARNPYRPRVCWELYQFYQATLWTMKPITKHASTLAMSELDELDFIRIVYNWTSINYFWSCSYRELHDFYLLTQRTRSEWLSR